MPSSTPVVTALRVIPVAGHDSMLLNLSGAHAPFFTRNLVIITGDPPKMGDYPFSTPVYDVDSVGLIRVIRKLNQGTDLAGNPIEAQHGGAVRWCSSALYSLGADEQNVW